MKKYALFILLSLFMATAYGESYAARTTETISFNCDSPTDNHPNLSFEIVPDSKAQKPVTITIQGNDGSDDLFYANIQSTTIQYLKLMNLPKPVIFVGSKPDSFISGNKDFYSNSISLVLMQKQVGLPGSQIAFLTFNNNVSVHICTKNN